MRFHQGHAQEAGCIMTYALISRWMLLLCLMALVACESDEETRPLANIIEVVQLPTATATNIATPLPLVTRTRIPPTITPTPTTPAPTATSTVTPTATPIPLVELVIAVLPIPMGAPIPPEAVRIVAWPQEAAPSEYFTALDQVINEVALVDIACFEPVLPQTVSYREIGVGFDPLPGTCPALESWEPAPVVNVVIARMDIVAGQRIAPEDVAFRAWPLNMIPPGGFQAMSEVLGQRARNAIRREQPVVAGQLTP
jgi:flagella basal body P-ring formation protein FlgA